MVALDSRNYLLLAFIFLTLGLGLAGGARAGTAAAGSREDPVVTRSYVQEAVDNRLAPLQQQLDEASKRLAALRQRLDSLK
ncbi:hypothetical protein MOTE_17010 [Moorella thermoacetica]|uniref:Matrilin coiled-coil trimerisation domain-containing protein n=1 Tax=Neomoorella thermoacetica TaxID=1525 RepID=A0A1J5P457_NEOTH|nr:hypothetical protein MOTE_17010 [Moorella thermoacetica]